MGGLRELERPVEAPEVAAGIWVGLEEYMSSMSKWEKTPLANRVALSYNQHELSKSPPRAADSLLFQPTTRVRKTVQ